MKRSNVPSKRADLRQDKAQASYGTVEATVLRNTQRIGRHHFLDLSMPSPSVPTRLFGRFFLARCADNRVTDSEDPLPDYATRSWDTYLRRPMFPVSASPLPSEGAGAAQRDGGQHGTAFAVRFLLPCQLDPGFDRLASRCTGDKVNLTGPFGREAGLSPQARRLLLVSAVQDAPLLIPHADQMLDQGGRVTFIVRGSLAEDSHDRAFISLLPLSVEAHFVESDEDLQRLLSDAIPWSDSLAANESAMSADALTQAINASAPWTKLKTEQRGSSLGVSGRAYFLAWSDLVCGFGACMACVVQRTDGSLTRACIHGPAFPLRELAG